MSVAHRAEDQERADFSARSLGRGPVARAVPHLRRAKRTVLWLLLPITVLYVAFFFAPLGIMGVYSFWITEDFQIIPIWTLDNYAAVFTKPAYTTVLIRTLWMAFMITLVTTVLGYLFAYFLVKQRSRFRNVYLVLVMLPFWTSILLRTYGWMTVLGEKGLINQVLHYLGLIDEPLGFLLYNKVAVIIVSLHLFIPFAILSSYTVLEKMDFRLVDAAKDLGAGPLRAFWLITLPQTMAGIWASILFVFIPVSGLFLTPALVGGTDSAMIGNLIINQFEVYRFGLGSAMAFLITFMITAFLIAVRRYINLEKIFA